ncbi:MULTISPECIES: hypothetical protein [unclassified Enterococcus]|uniref:hypothetical protein n=1 Tax=unclassified Enterococcus TaxID=2608891 RepID=UPI001557DACC|nr:MULTISPECIES: hypothetical protein [unclassified Enterococcus]MBS7576930.1 hypothetical protein [Enterococcus sp. MMGLQ5-2]MBS7584337.1 hypothetical protein [Enterococcus sp. MMGLQ5-1]NPD12193.1 hypothetical protein [Enterococcus sp. MMGLQ5-1]NPD36765.1 hypothetical protein [Enterococcus sp. MMGLQ5-2]
MQFNGRFSINNNIIIHPNLTIDEFIKTSLYEKQDLSRFFWIRKENIINNHNFYLGFLFKEKKISQIQFYCVDKNISTEEMRKKFNDNFVKELSSSEDYAWGNIKSIFNKRENIALLVINYK